MGAFKIPLVTTSNREIDQLQQNIRAPLEKQFSHQTGQFAATLTGFAVPLGLTVKYNQACAGGPVTLILVANGTGVTGTSNSINMALTGLPASLFPTTNQASIINVVDSGTQQAGLIYIYSNGVISFLKSVSGAGFTASGTKGLYGCTVTYAVGV